MAQKIIPFLWFNKNAAQAAKFYVKIFKNSKINHVDPMAASFRLDGLELIAFNGGPTYKLNPAVSLFISCKTQKEIDTYWKKLLAGGGKESRCGWLIDKMDPTSANLLMRLLVRCCFGGFLRG
jgi:predicted 3-demethylubiquinone-9 3-methyltransferase (glyoxalase superfamily)